MGSLPRCWKWLSKGYLATVRETVEPTSTLKPAGGDWPMIDPGAADG